nr:hypothetical protein [Tanacetum cinerariifolium]
MYDIKKSKSENKEKAPSEMELVLEQTQQGTSHEVSMEVIGEENSYEILCKTFDQEAKAELEDSQFWEAPSPVMSRAPEIVTLYLN